MKRIVRKPFPNDKVWTLPNREFADDNFRFDEYGRKFSKRVENTSVFKRLVLQTRKNHSLFGKGLKGYKTHYEKV